MGVVTETQPKVDEQFQDLLYDLLLRLRERREAERGPAGPRDVLYVSEVGTVIGESACWRKLWYDFHGAPKDSLPPETLMAFEMGTSSACASPTSSPPATTYRRSSIASTFPPGRSPGGLMSC